MIAEANYYFVKNNDVKRNSLVNRHRGSLNHSFIRNYQLYLEYFFDKVQDRHNKE